MDIRPTGNVVQPAISMPDRSTPAPETTSAPAPAMAPSVAAAAVQQPDPATNLARVTQAVKDLNKSMEALSQGLEFSVDTDTDKTVVKVIDQQTREVIRQMPTQEALDIAKAIDRMQGLLIKQKA